MFMFSFLWSTPTISHRYAHHRDDEQQPRRQLLQQQGQPRQQQRRRQRNRQYLLSWKLSMIVWTLLLLLTLCLDSVEAIFGFKRRAQARREAEEAKRLSKLVVIFGLEISKPVFYTLTSLVAIGVAVFILHGNNNNNSNKNHNMNGRGNSRGISGRRRRKGRGNRPNGDRTLDVVVVGCGLPKKGMGWFHLTQLLEMDRVNVRAVVEPFYMNPELCADPPEIWMDLVASLEDIGVAVVASIAELGTVKKKATMCLIAGRTHDNPKLFRECITSFGAKLIYLEKPGAPSVEELEGMRDLANKNDVKVYIGYNKNVTPYILQTIDLARKTPHSHVFFCHNNSYSQSDLPEVFARNPEGLLKNMAIHEMALLVTYCEVTVDSIAKFKVNASKLFSEKVSVWKPGTSLPNPEYITDFSRCAFKITTKSGRNVSVMADRCGGNVSFAVVKNQQGHEVNRFEYPSPDELVKIEEEVLADPTMMPYFFVQREDYWELKNRVVNAFLDGAKEPDGVATITVGIEALKLAEYATKELNKALKAK